MKILIISDIHGNLPALQAIDSYVNKTDLTICLGDIVGYHCYVNEVIDYLKRHNVVCIQGNHDRYIFEGLEIQTKVINDSVRFGIEIASKKISSGNKEWLKQLPTSLSFKFDNCSLLCCHGSPWDVTNGYVYSDSDLFPKMGEFAFDIIALGHTHRAYIKHEGSMVILNPGSIGQARDTEGFACAKIIDTTTKEITTIQEPYDYMTTINDSIAHGAQEWVYKHFQTVINK